MKEGGALQVGPRTRIKLTPELVDDIARHLASGAPLTYVAQAVGVDNLTIREWMRRGGDRLSRLEEDDDQAHGDARRDGSRDGSTLDVLCERLVIEVGRARGRSLVTLVGAAKAGRKGWQGSAWLLERLDRKRWAPPAQRVEHDGVLFDEHGRLTDHGERFASKLGEATTAALVEARVPRDVGERFIATFGAHLERLFRFGESADSEAARPRAGDPDHEGEHDFVAICKVED